MSQSFSVGNQLTLRATWTSFVSGSFAGTDDITCALFKYNCTPGIDKTWTKISNDATPKSMTTYSDGGNSYADACEAGS